MDTNFSEIEKELYAAVDRGELTPREAREALADLMQEIAYQNHVAHEGNRPYNENPDGCWYCGSDAHHSQDCRERN